MLHNGTGYVGTHAGMTDGKTAFGPLDLEVLPVGGFFPVEPVPTYSRHRAFRSSGSRGDGQPQSPA